MTGTKNCPTCGGTGQIGYFQGQSRFLLTWEECPRCCGTGLDGSAADERDGAGSKPQGCRKRRGKKKGR